MSNVNIGDQRVTSIQCYQMIHFLVERGAKLAVENKEGKNILCCVLARDDLCENLVLDLAKLLFELHPKLVSSTGIHAFNFTLQVPPHLIEFISKICLSELSKLDKYGSSALTYIVQQKNIDLVLQNASLIFENVEDVKDKVRAIKLARKQNNVRFQVIRYLLEKIPDYDVNSIIKKTGNTLLMQYGKTIENVEFLLSRNAQINLLNKTGHHVLCTASNTSNVELVMKLLENGADPLVILDNGKATYCLAFLKFMLQSLDVLEYTLNCPVIKNRNIEGSILSEFYIRIIELTYQFYSESECDDLAIQRLQILVNSNKRILNMRYRLEDDFFCGGHSFEVEPIGFLCANGKFGRDIISNPEKPVRFLNLMSSVGFSVQNTPEDCITPLTVLLLAFKEINTFVELQPMIAELIINKKVNIESMALSTSTDYIAENPTSYGDIVNFKNSLHLPDALFLAYHHYSFDLVKILLPHWWASPIGLFFCFQTDIEDIDFDVVYDLMNMNPAGVEYVVQRHLDITLPELLKYGVIPHGSDFFITVNNMMERWNVAADEAENSEAFRKFKCIWQKYQDAISKYLTEFV